MFHQKTSNGVLIHFNTEVEGAVPLLLQQLLEDGEGGRQPDIQEDQSP